MEAAVASVIADQPFGWDAVAHILLAGGSALLPGLRERVAAWTGRDPKHVFLSADSTHVVADGAANQAFTQTEGSHCLAGGLAVRLRDGDNGKYVNKVFFATGAILPAIGTSVEQLGQTVRSPGGVCTVAVDLREARPGVTAKPWELLSDDQVVRVRTLRRQVHLPRGQHDMEVGFRINPNGKLIYRFRFPALPDLDVLSGDVTDNGDEAVEAAAGRDVVLAFDCSSSMHGEKLAAEKKATHDLLDQIAADDVRVALIVFQKGSAEILCPLGTSHAEIRTKVDALVAGGGTPMHKALSLAGKHLADAADKLREWIVILTTDGHPNEPKSTQKAAQALKQSARLICLGLGSDVSEGYLMELVSTPNDCFFADASEIGRAFQTITELYLKPDGHDSNFAHDAQIPQVEEDQAEQENEEPNDE